MIHRLLSQKTQYALWTWREENSGWIAVLTLCLLLGGAFVILVDAGQHRHKDFQAVVFRTATVTDISATEREFSGRLNLTVETETGQEFRLSGKPTQPAIHGQTVCIRVMSDGETERANLVPPARCSSVN